MEEYNEFEVGERVRVVSEPYLRCPFSWVSEMDNYCGENVTIVDKRFDGYRNTNAYRIDADDTDFVWCGNCFEPIEEEAFERLTKEDLLSMLQR